MDKQHALKLYFSDYFEIPRKELDKHGAFDISLVADLPLFIDPFLLFQSKKPEYQALHLLIIRYLKYLRDISVSGQISEGRLKSLFYFSEIHQNFLGFADAGNKGHGLGEKFALALNANLARIFSSFGRETITKDAHLEKLCLISQGVGRDTISDFVTNLIKGFLLNYTQDFTREYIKEALKADFTVPRVQFDYETGRWTSDTFTLPLFNNDYVILTPKDILTREDTWISRTEYRRDFFTIVEALPNVQMQAELDEYLKRSLSKGYQPKDVDRAIAEFTRLHPELIDYFIRNREDNGEKAVERSANYVSESESMFLNQFGSFAQFLANNTLFYQTGISTRNETYKRIMFLKDAIENKGCWTIFYNKDKPITREDDLHVLFRLVWYGTVLDVSREVNDGRGPSDFKISYGLDKTVAEFKLASNSHLRENLQNQLELYKKASDAEHGFKIIIYFSKEELDKVNKILTALKMNQDTNVILIDAIKKISASKVRE